MWIALFLGYCLFCTNWLIFSKLKGNGSSSSGGGSGGGSGWGTVFSAISGQFASESVNYTVTLARGVFTIPASFILLKLGYRKACLFACGLATIALPLIFSPHWTILILGRIIMAAGGTLTIIYISPLLSKLTLPEKRKRLAALNGFTFASSGLLVNILFMISPVSAFLIKNWKWTAAVTALSSYIPLVLFYTRGRNFEIISLAEKLEVRIPDNYATLLREKEAWQWIISYSFLLVISILFSGFVPKQLTKLVTSLGSSIPSIDWNSLYTVIFFLGTCCGLHFLGKLNLKNIKRTSVVSFSIIVTLGIWGFMSIACLIYHFSQSIVANIAMLIGIFWLAFFGLGIQSVLLYIPLEYSNYSPQKTSIFFSCIWGIGYIILTAYYILSSVISTYIHEAAALVFVTILLALFYFFSTRLRESKPEYIDFWTWLTKERKLRLSTGGQA